MKTDEEIELKIFELKTDVDKELEKRFLDRGKGEDEYFFYLFLVLLYHDRLTDFMKEK